MPELRKMPTLAKARRERMREVREAFEDNYFDYQYRFVEFFVEHLTDMNHVFRGDLHQMIILGIIGQVRLKAVRAALVACEDPTTALGKKSAISASRIADISTIPRQTVRRKLDLLERKGWIERLSGSSWAIRSRDGVSDVRTELYDVDQRALSRIASLYADLEVMLREKA